MNIVTPDTPTTLLVDLAYMPFGIATAKGAFYAILRRRARGLDAHGAPYDWDRLVSGNLSIFPDQPCLRSAPRDGKDVVWPIATVVVCGHMFFYKSRRKSADGLPPLRDVFEYFNGICAFCGEKIKHISDASREHIHSQAYGKVDHGSNIALAHRSCNSLAGHAMPKLDKDGKEITEGMKTYASGFVLPRNVVMRPEWRSLLFLEAAPERFGSVSSKPHHSA